MVLIFGLEMIVMEKGLNIRCWILMTVEKYKVSRIL